MADQDFNIKVVTTADTSGLRQTSVSMAELQKQIQAQNIAAQQMGYQLGQALRVVAGGALIAGGYKFVSQLHEAATQIEKISSDLDKQGAQIVSNAQKFSEMSKFATDQADVLKIAEGSLKGVETAQKRMLDAAGEELTIWQKIADVWAAGFRDEGPIAAALKLKQETEAQNFEMARQNAILSITAAKLNETRRSTQTYAETVAELNSRIREQQSLADIHWAQKDISSYLSAAEAVEKYKKELQSVEAENAKAVKQTESNIQGADPQVRATLMQEQASRIARAQGRDRDADLYDKTADNLKRSATPAQRAQIEKAEADPNLIKAIEDLSKKMDDYWR